MLPSLGFQEILLLGVLALVVVGPKDLPLLLRKLGRWTARLRGMAQEFRSGFDELARQAELDELKREVEALRRTTSIQDIGRELSKPLPTLEDYAGVKQAAAPALEAPDQAPASQDMDPEALAAEKVKAKLAEAEQIKAKLAQAENAKLEHAKSEQAKSEQARAEQAGAEQANADDAKGEDAEPGSDALAGAHLPQARSAP